MRQEGMTPAEKKLWFGYLKNQAPRWRNQRPFGGYIVDFYCPALRLVVEIDGESHFKPRATPTMWNGRPIWEGWGYGCFA